MTPRKQELDDRSRQNEKSYPKRHLQALRGPEESYHTPSQELTNTCTFSKENLLEKFKASSPGGNNSRLTKNGTVRTPVEVSGKSLKHYLDLPPKSNLIEKPARTDACYRGMQNPILRSQGGQYHCFGGAADSRKANHHQVRRTVPSPTLTSSITWLLRSKKALIEAGRVPATSAQNKDWYRGSKATPEVSSIKEERRRLAFDCPTSRKFEN
ncbi:hypothetical protein RUND412_002370 [Rhizina undulata]